MNNGEAEVSTCSLCGNKHSPLSRCNVIDTKKERLYIIEAGKIVDTKDYHFVVKEDDIAKLNKKLDIIINMLSDDK